MGKTMKFTYDDVKDIIENILKKHHSKVKPSTIMYPSSLGSGGLLEKEDDMICSHMKI